MYIYIYILYLLYKLPITASQKNKIKIMNKYLLYVFTLSTLATNTLLAFRSAKSGCDGISRLNSKLHFIGYHYEADNLCKSEGLAKVYRFFRQELEATYIAARSYSSFREVLSYHYPHIGQSFSSVETWKNERKR